MSCESPTSPCWRNTTSARGSLNMTSSSLRGVLPDYCQVAVTLAYYSGCDGRSFSLDWKQVDLIEGKLFLRSQDTKTDSPRVLYLTGDLLQVLMQWKQRCEQKWPNVPGFATGEGFVCKSLIGHGGKPVSASG